MKKGHGATTSDSPIIKVENASFSYHSGSSVFSNVSFTLERGSSFSIIGPNGAGKSTLLHCLAHLLPLSEGSISINGSRLDQLKRGAIARLVGFVPQSLDSVYAYRVLDFIVMGRAPYISQFRVPNDDDYDRVFDVMKQLGIAHLANKPFTEISGGEQQQAAIARVLVQDPDMILMDEPTSALDFGNQMKIIKLVRQLVSENYTVIMTTHNPDHAIMLDGKVGILDKSGTLHVGEAQKIITEDVLSQVYNTEVKIAYVDEVGRNACLAK